MWAFLFGWLVGSGNRAARDAALPESVKQARYDAAVEYRKTHMTGGQKFWLVLGVLLLVGFVVEYPLVAGAIVLGLVVLIGLAALGGRAKQHRDEREVEDGND